MGRRGKKLPAPPFEDAFSNINVLEKSVMSRMIDIPFTPDDVIRWLFPDEVVCLLKAAFPIIRGIDRGALVEESILLPLAFPTVRTHLEINVDTPDVAMCVPDNGMVKLNPERGEPIIRTLTQVYEQHQRFETVRKVVIWLNDHATVGAARHYCPWLTSLLPADHLFQDANPNIYREPGTGIPRDIMEAMRASGAIMASALLAGEPMPELPGRTRLAVSFDGDVKDVREFRLL